MYERLGGYDTTYKSSGDYEFLLRAGKELKAGYVDKVTISMSLGGISNSSLLPIWETYYAIKKHSTINPFISFMGLIKSLLSWKVKRLLGLTWMNNKNVYKNFVWLNQIYQKRIVTLYF